MAELNIGSFQITRGSDLTETPLREWAAKIWDKGKNLGQAVTPLSLNFYDFTT
jgi:hypothetical protein